MSSSYLNISKHLLLTVKVCLNLKVRDNITDGSINLAQERQNKLFVTLVVSSIPFYLNIFHVCELNNIKNAHFKNKLNYILLLLFFTSMFQSLL